MEPYQNLSGDSGVVAYEVGPEFIRVRFIGGDTYLYDYETTGSHHVEEMKRLAKSGKGLAGYISREVKGRYSSRAG